MNAPLQVGLTLPLVGDFDLTQAEMAEALGYDALWVSEHIAFHVPTFDAVTTMAALAARTRRLRIGSAVLLLPLRPPAAVAKAVATLDVISGGRVLLGVGVGGEYPKEFEACGVPVKERGRRTDEAIAVLRALWTQETASFEGRYVRFRDVAMRPKPVQPGGPPIIVGGRSEAAMRRAARLGDGYMPYLFTPQQYAEALRKIDAFAREAGRSLAAFQPMLYQFVYVADTYEEAFQRANARLSTNYNQPFDRLIDRYCVVGPPEACVARLQAYVAAGARHLILVPTTFGAAEFAQQAQRLAHEVVPQLRAASSGNSQP
ncbi:MAG: LLM class F420-dependent oxidoreductase [Candidatus Tectimicrobiota bacterium]|nr:MAG: LLM class F420-dependent oxidoreductase [Candidatus Tectomicrobia bacterium]